MTPATGPADTIKTPYMFEPGDMGEYILVQVAVDANGESVCGRRQVKPGIYTGGYNADGTLTLTEHGRTQR